MFSNPQWQLVLAQPMNPWTSTMISRSSAAADAPTGEGDRVAGEDMASERELRQDPTSWPKTDRAAAYLEKRRKW